MSSSAVRVFPIPGGPVSVTSRISSFDKYLRTSAISFSRPISEARADYWSGRALEALKKKDEARYKALLEKHNIRR